MKKIFMYLLLTHFFQGFLLAQENNIASQGQIESEDTNKSVDEFSAMLDATEPAGDISASKPQKHQISYVALMIYFIKNGMETSYNLIKLAASQIKDIKTNGNKS